LERTPDDAPDIATAEEVDNARLEDLKRFDGNTIANAIETFEVRLRNEGFAAGAIGARFGDRPPVVGRAVTARIRSSTPPPVGHSYNDRTDWWTYIISMPAPRIVVVEDLDDPPGVGAFIGSVHAHILHALGCVAYVTNGSVRDVAAVRDTGFQFFAPSISVSHAFVHLVDFGEPVTVGGLRVRSGDIVYGDAHGLLTVPRAIIRRIPAVATQMLEAEQRVIDLCLSPRFSLDALRTLVRPLG
jgi:regulator of RNase E activity RraA